MRPLFKAQDLRDKIVIQSLSETPDGAGGFTRSWTGDDAYAQVLPTGGREALLSTGLQAIQGFRITIRYRPALNPEDRLLWRGRVLNIRSAADPDGMRRWTVIYADAGTVNE